MSDTFHEEVRRDDVASFSGRKPGQSENLTFCSEWQRTQDISFSEDQVVPDRNSLFATELLKTIDDACASLYLPCTGNSFGVISSKEHNSLHCKIDDVVNDSESDAESISFPMLQIDKEINADITDRKKTIKTKNRNLRRTEMSDCPRIIQKGEIEIASILCLQGENKTDKRDSSVHVCDGNLCDEVCAEYNSSFLKKGSSCLIPKYHRNESKRIEDDCPFQEMCHENPLSNHEVDCSEKSLQQQLLMTDERDEREKFEFPVSTLFQEMVLDKLKDDEISRLIRNDILILKYGERLMFRQIVKSQLYTRLRELGRLLKLLRKCSQMKVKTLTAALDPVHFSLLISCIQQLCEFCGSTGILKNGYLARQIICSLKKCCYILQAEALKNSNEDQLHKAFHFNSLFEQKWQKEFSPHVAPPRSNNPKLMTSVSDIDKVIALLEIDRQSDSFSTLAKATLCAVTIFNRNRGEKVHKMKVTDFRHNLKKGNPDPEVLPGLSATEIKLTNVLQRVEVLGKFSQPVAILLTSGMSESIHKLLQMRNILGMNSIYLFSTPGDKTHYLCSQVIRYYASAANVDDMNLFTSHKLKKQLGTLCQAAEVSKMDQDHLMRFLGHVVKAHRKVDKKPLTVMEKIRIASILLNINGCMEMPLENAKDKTKIIAEGGTDSMEVTHLHLHQEPELVSNEMITVGSSEQIERTFMQREREKNDAKISPQIQGPFKSKQRMVNQRVPWTENETAAVKRQLQECFLLHRLPHKHEIEMAIEKEDCLRHRSWRNIKYHVYNKLKDKRL